MQRKEVEAVRRAVTTDTCCLATALRRKNGEQLKFLAYLSTSHPHPGATLASNHRSGLLIQHFWPMASFSPPAKSRKILIVNLLLFFQFFSFWDALAPNCPHTYANSANTINLIAFS